MRRLLLILTVIALAALPTAGQADYSFSVDKNISDVYVNKDGSASIEYKLTFTCQPGGKPIDIVDVGLPNSSYAPSDFKAWLDGKPLSTIRPSEYVKPGIEIPLSGMEIGPNQTGTLKVKGKVGRMVWEDSKDKNYTSVEFKPTWYGDQWTTGTTHLEIRMHFPKGVTSNETKYHKEKPTRMDATGSHIVFTWAYPNASPSKSVQVGIGYPRSYAQTVYKKTLVDTLAGCFGAIAGCFGALLVPWVFPIGIFIAAFVFSWRRQRRRMMKYLPPELSVEGVGIKRGLTAPEAALIQETPLDRVMTMVLFGLLKKGALAVENAKPLKLKITRDEAIDRGVKLHPYEVTFIDCIKKDGTLSQPKAENFVVDFIKQTNRKLKGFSRKETAAYYKKIAQEAWKMVEEADTPMVAGNAFDQRAEWLLMEDKFDDRLRRSVRHQTVFVPDWWTFHGSGTATPVSGGGASMSLPDFANSVTDSLSGFANGLVSNVSEFTSGITGRTNPPPVSSGGSSGGGGSGCACACACAGCACACAGGGR